MNCKHKKIFFLLFFISIFLNILCMKTRGIVPTGLNIPYVFLGSPKIEKINISGSGKIPKQAILSRVPFVSNNTFTPKQCNQMVKNIYNLGCFSNVSVSYEELDKGKINLNINVEEKRQVSSISFKGNNHMSNDTLEKKLSISKIRWMDNEGALVLCKKIEKLYREKYYNNVKVEFEIIPAEGDSIGLVIRVNEGVSGKIQSINFVGNKNISRHKLKEAVVAKEHWLLGFFDGSGSFRKEMISYDRYQLENFYQNYGYFDARVLSSKFTEDGKGKIKIVHEIDEGDIYRFGNIVLPKDSPLPSFEVRNAMTMNSGDIFSRDAIKNSINNIRDKLGEIGFMYANIYPKIKVDKTSRRVNLEIGIDNGKLINIRNINIKGNTKTRDKIIRREILFNEGDLLTTKKLSKSKRAVETLGYFTPQTGVNWNMSIIDKHQADLELAVQEAKTGRFYLSLGINSGGSASPSYHGEVPEISWYRSLFDASKVSVTLQDSNWRGLGIRYYLNGSYANVDKSLGCGLSTNWFLDLPLSAGVNTSFRGLRYEDFRQTIDVPVERSSNVNFQFGYRIHQLNMMLLGVSTGMDVIKYTGEIVPRMQFPDNPAYQMAFSEIVSRSFQPGAITWATFSLSDDKRDHPVRPSNGYQWIFDTKVAAPMFPNEYGQMFGFVKAGIDFRWYTPLIMKYNTILHIHGYAGIIKAFPGCNVPYKELFHVGGQQSVRGFYFGQIGPSLLGSSLGGSKAFFTNIEIQQPINKAETMLAALFYDGGAAWDTIFNNKNLTSDASKGNLLFDIFDYTPPDVLIQNNSIHYRHSVGVSLILTAPTPLRLNWGFKLDRNKRLGEKLYEFDLIMEGSY
jgi:outer membrane protein insertion porin family